MLSKGSDELSENNELKGDELNGSDYITKVCLMRVYLSPLNIILKKLGTLPVKGSFPYSNSYRESDVAFNGFLLFILYYSHSGSESDCNVANHHYQLGHVLILRTSQIAIFVCERAPSYCS